MLTVPDVDRLYERLISTVVAKCDRCGGNGHICIEKDDDYVSSPCECMIAVQFAVGRVEGNIPREFWDADTIQTEAYDFVEIYCSNMRLRRKQGEGLLFYGDLGRGKTTTACAVLIAAIRHGFTAGYITATDYVTSSVPASSSPELCEYRTAISHADFLVLDEFGNEYRKNGSDFAKTELEGLIRWRRSHNRPTILCVNHENASEFKAKTGDVIWSLLGGRTKSYVFSGKDHRRA